MLLHLTICLIKFQSYQILYIGLLLYCNFRFILFETPKKVSGFWMLQKFFINRSESKKNTTLCFPQNTVKCTKGIILFSVLKNTNNRSADLGWNTAFNVGSRVQSLQLVLNRLHTFEKNYCSCFSLMASGKQLLRASNVKEQYRFLCFKSFSWQIADKHIFSSAVR